ncbi:lysozyme inhibitor LprI family protein [Paraburkholderia tagetis]|uniref:DUF1311 domain-containing protein n=1 Tax=Paraburkholderia tagetis TaxID=2913261 RepID=A0A9X1RPA3_9BURK|nr:DUF1311 domain-containing protein [Paraburkholderia tagetis]
MRTTEKFILRAVIAVAILPASIPSYGETIYSVPFDYKKATPTSVYFHGMSKAEIDHLCKTGEHAGTADIAACSQRDFEQSADRLDVLLRSEEADYKKNDADLLSDNYPVALPHFQQAQRAWADYRANQCYAETYSSGQASMRYMTFWDCMTRITKERIADLKSSKD